MEIYTTGLVASLADRTVRGLVLPYGQPGRTSLGRVTAARGVLTLGENILANVGHDRNVPVGRASAVDDGPDGLRMTFSIANVPAGDALLAEIAAGLRDGLSVEVDGPIIRGGQLQGGTLTHVGFVTEPAFPDARLAAMVAADAGEVTQTPDGATVITTPTSTVTVTVEDTQEAPPVDDLTPATPDPTPATAAAVTDPPAAAQAPASLQAQAAGRTSGGRLTAADVADLPAFLRLTAQANRDRDPRLLAALQDITQTGVGSDVTAPQFVQELWSGVAYDRVVVPLLTQAPLTSYKVRGWRWVTKPEVAAYAGDKTNVPSNVPDTEAVEVEADRLAGAHDFDRKFVDFGDTGFLDSYYRAMAESYARKSDAAALAGLVAGATIVSPGSVPTDISAAAAALVDGALSVIDKGVPNWAIVSKGLYRSLLLTPRDQVLELLTMALGLTEGSLGGFRIVPRTDLADGQVLVGVKAAATWYELGGGSPIRVDAVDLTKGGVDTGVFGYYAEIINDADALALVDAVPASIDVVPATKTLAVAGTQQLQVNATFADGSVVDVTNAATYVSAQPVSASVSATGLVTALGSHAAFNVTATFGGKTDTCAVTVS